MLTDRRAIVAEVTEGKGRRVMGKTIHTVSSASGVILKASRSKENCEAFISGRLGNIHFLMEPVTTAEGDPATLYKQAEQDGPYGTVYVLTTVRLT